MVYFGAGADEVIPVQGEKSMDTVRVRVYGKSDAVFVVEKTMPNMGEAIIDALENNGTLHLHLAQGGTVLINFAECMAVVVDGG